MRATRRTVTGLALAGVAVTLLPLSGPATADSW